MSHGEVWPAAPTSRRLRLSVKCAFPHLGKRGAGSRKSTLCPDGLTEKRTLARTHRARLTEKCTLAAPPGRTSPKDALWLGRHLQNASLREASYEKTHSGRSGARKMRFSVTSDSRVRFSVECAFPHLGKCGAGSRKSAFCPSFSPKGAFWPDRLTQSRTLRFSDRTDCAFLSHRGAREVWGNPPRQPAGHYGECLNWANALEQPPASLRGGCARARKPRPGVWLHGGAQSGQRASLMARPGPGRDTIKLPVVG